MSKMTGKTNPQQALPYPHLSPNVTPMQHGFWRQRSIVSNLIEYLHELIVNIHAAECSYLLSSVDRKKHMTGIITRYYSTTHARIFVVRSFYFSDDFWLDWLYSAVIQQPWT